MSNVLVPRVGFAGTTTTHLLSESEWWPDDDLWTVCGFKATAVGYYQIGMAEVHCLECLTIHTKGSK